jgi:hypothetical protein
MLIILFFLVLKILAVQMLIEKAKSFTNADADKLVQKMLVPFARDRFTLIKTERLPGL